MRKRIVLLAACFAIGLLVVNIAKHESKAQQDENAAARDGSTADEREGSVEHGKYIVHHVAMCIYCHTPKNEAGELEMRRLLQGAPMPVDSPFPKQTWAFQAPKIAGLPGGWTGQDMVRFLSQRETPTGYLPRPPMPPFRMTEEDARAVTAYLESLQ